MARKTAIRRGDRDAAAHAHQLAEAAAEAWGQCYVSNDVIIPMSTVAVLALLTPPEAERDDVAVLWMECRDEDFTLNVRGLWQWFTLHHPYLVNRAWPLMEPWFDEDKPMEREVLRGARMVANAVLRNGLLWLTGDPWRRRDADLLGKVLTDLRPKVARQGRGQFYTPDSVTELMARMTFPGDVEDGTSINDPCCGTGGMFRGSAEALLGMGRDPAKMRWVGVDLDYVAVACAAVNAVIWGLGPNVLLAVGDSLLDDFWHRAQREREEPIEIMRDLRAIAAVQRLTSGARDLVDQVAAEVDEGAGDGSTEVDPTDMTEHVDDVDQADEDTPADEDAPDVGAEEAEQANGDAGEAEPDVDHEDGDQVIEGELDTSILVAADLDLGPVGRDTLTLDLWALVDKVAEDARRTA